MKEGRVLQLSVLVRLLPPAVPLPGELQRLGWALLGVPLPGDVDGPWVRGPPLLLLLLLLLHSSTRTRRASALNGFSQPAAAGRRAVGALALSRRQVLLTQDVTPLLVTPSPISNPVQYALLQGLRPRLQPRRRLVRVVVVAAVARAAVVTGVSARVTRVTVVVRDDSHGLTPYVTLSRRGVHAVLLPMLLLLLLLQPHGPPAEGKLLLQHALQLLLLGEARPAGLGRRVEGAVDRPLALDQLLEMGW
jgi:hypothetical protein